MANADSTHTTDGYVVSLYLILLNSFWFRLWRCISVYARWNMNHYTYSIWFGFLFDNVQDVPEVQRPIIGVWYENNVI